GVELGGHLGELVVGLGQLAHLHGLRGDLDLRLLARAVAAGELRDEGGGLLGGQADERLVEALEHVALADAVGDALEDSISSSSMVAIMSRETKSPSSAGRSTPTRVPKRSRSSSRRTWTASASTSGSSISTS